MHVGPELSLGASGQDKVVVFLGKPLLYRMDEFPEKIKMALDPPPLVSEFVVDFPETRVAKCHRYGRYICVKIFKGWGKK